MSSKNYLLRFECEGIGTFVIHFTCKDDEFKKINFYEFQAADKWGCTFNFPSASDAIAFNSFLEQAVINNLNDAELC